MMPTPLQVAAASPVTFVFENKQYRVSPLSQRDIGELLAWVQTRMIETCRKNVNGASAEERVELLDRAINRANRLTFDSEEFMAALQTPDGILQLAWLTLRQHQPELSTEDVAQMLRKPEFSTVVMTAFDRATGVEAKRAEASSKKKKATRRKVKRKTKRKKRA